MAEAIAVVSLVATISQLLDYGITVTQRLNEFMTNVQELPQSFAHINSRLPLIMATVNNLRKRADGGEFPPDTEPHLKRVIEALEKELRGLDAVLRKILPSARASTWEKGIKAVKSVAAQKNVESFASVIQDYVSTLTAFQISHGSDQINSEQIKRIIRSIDEHKIEEELISPRPVQKPIWMLDHDTDEHFVGRDEIMSSIEQQYEDKAKRVAIAGIGGVGKSRIAIQYCHEQKQRESEMHIFWVHAGSRAKFEAAYQNIARLLDIPGWEDNERQTTQIVRDWLSEQETRPWLMILDNADDHDLWLKFPGGHDSPERSSRPLIEYLPRSHHGRLLITTRDHQLGYRLTEGKQSPISVMRLGLEEANALLQAKLFGGSTLDREDADELTAALEYLPLTITQAAAYLNQTEVTASEYLDEFRAGRSDIPEILGESIDDPSRDRETSNSVFQTWRLSFEQISKNSPRAADLLSLMAMLDRQGISQELLKRPDESLIQFKAAISKLKAFSFIEEEKKLSRYSMHRLVQLSTQRWVKFRDVWSVWQEAALSAVSRCCPPVAEFKDWPLFLELGPHVSSVLQYDVQTMSEKLHRANILHCFGHYMMEQGQEMLAQEFFSEAQKLRRTCLGQDHQDTLTTMGLLGVAYSKSGPQYLHKAQELQLEVYEITQRVLGFSHRLTLKTMSRLAITYNKEGKIKECRELQAEVLQLLERNFGPEDLDTLTEMSNLLYTLNLMKRGREAEDIGLLALSRRTKVLGATHPDTLTIMSNLSRTYIAQDRWKEAMELDEQVVTLRTQTLGPDHPKTLFSMDKLARTYKGLARWADAEALQRRIIDARIRVQGPDHHDTLTAKRQLVVTSEAVLRAQRRVASPLRMPGDALKGPRGGGRGRASQYGGGRHVSLEVLSIDSLRERFAGSAPPSMGGRDGKARLESNWRVQGKENS